MAEAFGITEAAWLRWTRRHRGAREPSGPRGRPEVIPQAQRAQIRKCYRDHYGQWGPTVLASWCERQELGSWSPTTIASVIADLREPEEGHKTRIRYEIVAPGVMWSEDGTGFRDRGRKKELIVVQDEHARLKLGHELVPGPADENAVVRTLRAAFEAYGAPLVLKHDGGSIFHGEKVARLLEKYRVVELTGPRGYPQYNGKKERSMRDIKSYERAMRRSGVRGSLRDRLEAVFRDLNEDRPRPVLGGRTARETYEEDRALLPDRGSFIREVNRQEERLRRSARSRTEVERARRRAVEQTLWRYGLMTEWCDVSPQSGAKTGTE